ncbi:hypothetical protein EON65_53775 [archaeon]|nr:MAG: hypothetical protein EON65_53775 [archaeon]
MFYFVVKRKADSFAAERNPKEIKSTTGAVKASGSPTYNDTTGSSNNKEDNKALDSQAGQPAAAGIVGLFSDYGSDDDQDSERN